MANKDVHVYMKCATTLINQPFADNEMFFGQLKQF